MQNEPTYLAPTRRRHGALLAVMTLMIAASAAPPLRAQQACDCSCEAYGEMLQLAEKARAAAESGNFADIPAGAAEMGRCAAQCATQWAQCANPGAAPRPAPGRFAPNAAADTPGPSAPNAAGSAESVQRLLQQNRQQQEQAGDPGLPKARLTTDYLEGMWCSVYGGQETTQWRFDEQGRYEIGIPAGGGFAMQGDLKSLDNFREGFDRLIELESDTFTTEDRAGRTARKNVFTRGPCD
jgi:hypothetical protein